MRGTRPMLLALGAVAVALGPAVARAEDGNRTPPRAEAVLAARPVDDATLASQSGGASTTSTVVLNGAVTDNQASGVVSGNNMIGAGAFSNSNGLPIVIQNSGNNVLIQNSTVINVQSN